MNLKIFLSSSRSASIFAGFAAVCLLADSAWAQTYRSWTGDDSAVYADGLNWNASPYPDGPLDRASFGQTATNYTVDLGSATVNLEELNVTASTNVYTFQNGTFGIHGQISDSGGLAIFETDFQLADQTITLRGSAPGAGLRISSNITGSGSNSAVSLVGVVRLDGNNTFQGGVTMNNVAKLIVGHANALGTGVLTLGDNGANSNLTQFRQSGTTALSLGNSVSWKSQKLALGATGTGELTFLSGVTLNYSNTMPVSNELNWKTDSDVRINGGVQAGSYDGIVRFESPNAAAVTLGATSNRTGVSILGGPATGVGAIVRVTADNALGTGDIQLTANTSRLLLNGSGQPGGGITLVNNVDAQSTMHLVPPWLLSEAGNNEISGSVKISSGTGGQERNVSVLSDSLTLSGGVNGATPISTNYLSKYGAGTLILSGTTDSGVAGFFIYQGAMRATTGQGLTSVQGLRFLAAGADNAALETSGTFSRTLGTGGGQVAWMTNSSGGFAAQGAALNIQLNAGTSTMNWGSTGSFVGTGARLIFGSAKADNVVDFQNGLNLNGASRTIEVLDNSASTADFAQISGVVSGAGASSTLVKTGLGVLTLTNANTYAGGTIVNAGTLLINNTTGSGSGFGTVAINAGGTLGGSGVISGATTIASGATLSPGNSPGNLTFGDDLILAGTYKWELAGLSTADPGTNFDTITVTEGNVDITGASINLALEGFAPTNVSFWQTDQTWLILNNTGAGTLAGAFASIDNSAWAPLGAFTTSSTGNDANLVWTAVPEPSTGMLLVAGLAVVAFLRRNRVA